MYSASSNNGLNAVVLGLVATRNDVVVAASAVVGSV